MMITCYVCRIKRLLDTREGDLRFHKAGRVSVLGWTSPLILRYLPQKGDAQLEEAANPFSVLSAGCVALTKQCLRFRV